MFLPVYMYVTPSIPYFHPFACLETSRQLRRIRKIEEVTYKDVERDFFEIGFGITCTCILCMVVHVSLCFMFFTHYFIGKVLISLCLSMNVVIPASVVFLPVSCVNITQG